MPADTKRKFQTTEKSVSTRRRAKKAKLATAQAQKTATTTPSHKDRRNAARSPKLIKRSSHGDGEDESEGEDEDMDQDEDDEEGDHEAQNEDDTDRSSMSQQALRSEDEDEDEVEDRDDEAIPKGKKGYRKKVKKPSGKKGKVFADTVRYLHHWGEENGQLLSG